MCKMAANLAERFTHSLINKTVFQLRPKSTTGSSFLVEHIRYLCRKVWSITPKNSPFVFLCELKIVCVRAFMLNISLILLHKWFRWCRYRHSVVILVILYAWRSSAYGSYWLAWLTVCMISCIFNLTVYAYFLFYCCIYLNCLCPNLAYGLPELNKLTYLLYLAYFCCCHLKCIVTQNGQRRLVHAIKARQPRSWCEAANGSFSTIYCLNCGFTFEKGSVYTSGTRRVKLNTSHREPDGKNLTFPVGKPSGLGSNSATLSSTQTIPWLQTSGTLIQSQWQQLSNQDVV